MSGHRIFRPSEPQKRPFSHVDAGVIDLSRWVVQDFLYFQSTLALSLETCPEMLECIAWRR